ncbi:AraC family transcriptional regulator [Kutzneria sp. CA-103260]|uniref:AraC family transcriptional regulator n=1 Tax=Kutzneria sp. CA-103260 TaxID=2802641 RepID=UPI002011435B|nr:AraC family transcriptional regulator [Kutzneria sp. CA-103260]
MALDEIRDLVARHARPDGTTAITGLRLSSVDSTDEHHSLTAPQLVLLAQGGKRLLLGEEVFEYRAGDCLVVSAEVPVSGHFFGISRQRPALGLGLELRPTVIAPLLLAAPADRRSAPAMATGKAEPELLDAVLRLVRLLDQPGDVKVLAPLYEQEILWRLLTGPHGALVRQIGLADSGLSLVGRAISWIRDNYAEPIRVADLARLAGMSESAFHRHFRAVTTMSPIQYRKLIRLQEARALLVARPGDVAGIGHLVGYDSPTQFSREYRELFGAPPGQDAARLRADGSFGVMQLP